MALDHNILLEVGTNEFEVVEFIIRGERDNYYGINVAKVREIIKFPEVIHVPEAHPAIVGTANVRNKIIPIINLAYWLNIKYDYDPSTAKVIITYFNLQYNGFIVDDITRIHRVTWADIKDYATISDFQLANSVLGVVNINNRLVQLLDFEKIVSEINPNTKMVNVEIDYSKSTLRSKKHVFLAEDSDVIRKLLVRNLESAGYRVTAFENGKKLLNAIDKSNPDIIVTDLEMPVADGTFLIKTLRSTDRFKNTPIVVFSSLASEENEKKVLGIGANAFIGKPDMSIMINTLDKLVL
ncbi:MULTISPECIES: chemotaxis protein CheV [Calditerrivibrio]|uniref:Chemotaxis protein CheV n=1 Tax=Calditerrivibrio nitroreducens TaxID=477976 RepID=A0A2J6WI60_9BACT|nr:MAG: chemotaxis protein CheV [Calditerrivibrio nitroreducens]